MRSAIKKKCSDMAKGLMYSSWNDYVLIGREQDYKRSVQKTERHFFW